MSKQDSNKIETGRSGAGMSQAQAAANPGVVDGDREANAHGVTRENRTHAGGASKTLGVPRQTLDRLKKEGRHPHWGLANDKGRIDQLYEMGYQHVVDEKSNNICRGTGSRTQYLMSIPQLWHDDDKKLKRKRALASLGKEAEIGDQEYSPNQSDSALSSKVSASPLD